LLDREREMILSGKIDGLPRVTQEKERLIGRLAGMDTETGALARVRGKVERNQELLAAAARGLKAATRRMGAMTKRETNLRTYGRDGASASLTPAPSGINHRA
jgi:hypothetical protein